MLCFEKKRGIYTSLFLILCLSFVNAQSYSKKQTFSKGKISNLLQTEHLLIEFIESELLDLEEQLYILQSFLKDIHVEHIKSERDPEAYLSNPLNAFALIRRTHEGWPKILKYIQKRKNEGGITAFYDVHLPTRQDLQAAIADLEHLRDTYDLDPIKIAYGNINGEQYSSRLSPFNAFTIGFELYKLEKYEAAASWFSVSLQADNDSLLPTEISSFDIVKSHLMYVKTLSRLDKQIEALEAAETAIDLYPENDLVIKVYKDMTEKEL